jgi:hypothetical protein
MKSLQEACRPGTPLLHDLHQCDGCDGRQGQQQMTVGISQAEHQSDKRERDSMLQIVADPGMWPHGLRAGRHDGRGERQQPCRDPGRVGDHSDPTIRAGGIGDQKSDAIKS